MGRKAEPGQLRGRGSYIQLKSCQDTKEDTVRNNIVSLELPKVFLLPRT